MIITSVKGIDLRITGDDIERIKKVLEAESNNIESVTIRKSKWFFENQIRYYVIIEFFNERKYTEIFEKYFSKLRNEFEILKIKEKW